MVGLFGGTKVEVWASDMTRPEGSSSLLEGEETEDGRLEVPFVGDGTELFVALGAAIGIDTCRSARLGLAGNNSTLGEAKRERMFRNADFFFGGMGIDKRAAGRLGFFI